MAVLYLAVVKDRVEGVLLFFLKAVGPDYLPALVSADVLFR